MKCIFFGLILAMLGFFLLRANAKFRFTNLNCTSLDKEFCDFEYCYIKAYNRSFKYVSVRLNIYKTPVTNVSVRWALLKRANGYKPFLYDFTFNACDFLRSKKGNPVGAYFYDLFKKYSNVNTTCPINDDIIVDKLDASYLDQRTTIILPLPRGEYCFVTDWIAYGIARANVRAFAELT